ncbi:AAA family ATPase [Vibrio parahaemolyticus]|uniref:ATP-dependent nuclease n=4 Tax=Vibrio harveyi group TaxID=717610 RepID=UPI00165509CC|nr:AAA family ATPase [Vibrio parahaemolyticus]MBC8664120.1 AAA family ATPase [Vibrio parahaemolyticus]
MHIKSLEITNFRKFRDKSNTITFVEPTSKTDDESMISSSTTLVVGKNNSGKTTVTQALNMVVSEQGKINGHDFNYSYIDGLLNDYLEGRFNRFPNISFKITFITNPKEASLVNSKKAISLGQATNKNKDVDSVSEFSLVVDFQLNNKIKFEEDVKELLDKFLTKDRSFKFRKLLDLISEFKFEKFVRSDEGVAKSINISSLIELKVISAANNIHDNRLLSKAFNKIIKYKYQTDKNDFEEVNNLIENNNNGITTNIRETHESVIQNVLQGIVGTDSLGIDLRADLTFDKLMDGLITYEHKDAGFLVPEGQFGLGYANLISIVSEIIDYIERNPSGEKTTKVRLICIEEPETFMHPQMQVNFIRHIDNAVRKIIGEGEKIKSQLLITTHSSHILNSKIHSSSSLDNINYIYPHKSFCESISIKDEDISIKSGNKDEFYFVKKHIKHQVPELFFADGVVFVEGITEERLLNFYIERDEKLSKKLISVFRVDGAHAKVYDKLMKQLKIPSLIITDIDFKRSKEELTQSAETKDGNLVSWNIYPQMTEILDSRMSTNKTLSYYYDSSKVKDYNHYYESSNIKVVFQKDPVKIKLDEEHTAAYYATSLEEALVLENYDNEIFRGVINSTVPSVYSDVVLEDTCEYLDLAHNSFRIQKELSSAKSKFANNIIYELVVNEDSTSLPVLPSYINDGLQWLSLRLDGQPEGV